ncbi:hypothetical protein BHE74_00005764 [Ensete ventricosum]|uniref:Uncharacterized protein n=1 Tax=Ensete ventricosum TaxID=4639 RepID=A0A427BC63_ENSVE|nr:hypothetical protein B296_00002031 [Ensete ventricosum]RWW85540.1 hypothetical protein BHE74_00005764 [Ensete ventricosum]
MNRQVKNITVRDGKTLQEVVFYNRHGRRKCHRESCCSTRDLEKDFSIKCTHLGWNTKLQEDGAQNKPSSKAKEASNYTSQDADEAVENELND